LRWLNPPLEEKGAALLLLVVVIAGAALVNARARQPAADSRLLVGVTVPPQEWLVRRLAGDRVGVEVLLPPGASEHTYEPTPQQMARLAAAPLLVTVGHPALLFEQRLLAGVRGTGNHAAVVDMSRGAALLSAPGEAHGDPHLWLSPQVMRRGAIATAAALERLDPTAARSYEGRLDSVLADVDGVARDVRATLCGARHRRLYVYHPAWGYLLHDCGIEQVAIETEGKEPSARELVALVDAARRDGARALFVQRGFSDRPARAIAQEIGARVVVVDPLAVDWPANLRQVAKQFREALDG